MTINSKQPCCSTDEGRPLGTGLQEQVPNHLQRLWSKATVVSTEGKGLARLGHVGDLSYGFILWVVVALAISRFTRTCFWIPALDLTSESITVDETTQTTKPLRREDKCNRCFDNYH